MREYYDFHVHVGERIGGYRLRDGFADLNRIGGLAGIGAFVTEESGYRLSDKLRDMRCDASREYYGKVLWHLTPVHSTFSEVISLLSPDTDLKFYTTYRNAGLYRSYEDIDRWMQALADHKPRMLVHCEDDKTNARYAEKYPFHHPFDHSLRRPELAENIAVERVLDLAIRHNYPVHIVHVSSPKSAILIHEAKSSCPLITCETAPHYLISNDGALTGKDAHRMICSPPLRSEKTRGELVEMMQDGLFDIIASDHCPFTDEDKDRYKETPEKVPCGIPGVATIFTAMEERFVQTGMISEDRLSAMLCTVPGRLIKGDDA